MLDFYFDQQSGGLPKILRNVKLFNFFCITHNFYLMHSKRREPSLHGWPDKQISDNVSATLAVFLFWSTKWKDSPNIPEVRTFKTFCWLEYYWCKLFFEAPTWLGMVIDDTVRLVCLHTCHCWEKFLGNDFDQIQLWYGQVMSLKLD